MTNSETTNTAMFQAARRVSGAEPLVADLRLPRMLAARLLRSPYPHARIVRIDIPRALTLEGVVAVITGDHLPELDGARVLAGETVSYVGQPVACVVAISAAAAAQAVETIEVEYEPLVPAFGGSGEDGEQWGESSGDVDRAFASADVFHSQHEFAATASRTLGREASVAQVSFHPLTGAVGSVEVWADPPSTEAFQHSIARLLGIEAGAVSLLPGAGGDSGSLPLVAALASRATGLPVQVVSDSDAALWAGGGKARTLVELRFAATPEGKIIALDAHVTLDCGAATPARAALAAPLQRLYGIADLRVQVHAHRTNRPPATTAAGAAALAAALEMHFDELAAALRVDPALVRRANLASGNGGEAFAALETVVEKSRWRDRPGPGRGIGLAAAPSGAVAAEISLDWDTGGISVGKLWAAQVCRSADATAHAGAARAITAGFQRALYDELTWHNGLPRRGAMNDATPLISPEIVTSLVESSRCEDAAGDGLSAATTAAIANAIHNLAQVRLTAIPFTPERVHAGLRAQVRRRASGGGA